jgi:DNA-binding ferritin-like protein
VLSSASDAGDEGTVALMSEFIGAAEKKLWMLNSL